MKVNTNSVEYWGTAYVYTHVHGLLLNAELEFSCLSHEVRLVALALYCLDSAHSS